MWLTYLKTIWSFQVLFLRCIKQDQSSAHLELLTTTEARFLCICSIQCWVNHEILQSASWEQALSPALWKCGHCSPNPLAWFFPKLCSFFTCNVLITTRLNTRGQPLQIFRVLPLCSSLFLQTQSGNSVHLQLPDSAVASQLCQAQPGFSFPEIQTRNPPGSKLG